MFHSFLIGLIATSSLNIGGLITSWFSFSQKTIGIIMAFEAGAVFLEAAFVLTCECWQTRCCQSLSNMAADWQVLFPFCDLPFFWTLLNWNTQYNYSLI